MTPQLLCMSNSLRPGTVIQLISTILSLWEKSQTDHTSDMPVLHQTWKGRILHSLGVFGCCVHLDQTWKTSMLDFQILIYCISGQMVQVNNTKIKRTFSYFVLFLPSWDSKMLRGISFLHRIERVPQMHWDNNKKVCRQCCAQRRESCSWQSIFYEMVSNSINGIKMEFLTREDFQQYDAISEIYTRNEEDSSSTCWKECHP